MSLADKISAMPSYLWGRECHPTERVYTYADVQEMVLDFRALAAKHDEVMRMMAEALELIAGTDPIDAALDPQRAVRVASSALKAHKELQ